MGDHIRSLLHRTSSCHQPWQLSAALALGVVCGLLPKFSLLFCGLLVLCCSLPIHLPLAAASCFIFSFLAGPLSQIAGRAGLWSLTHSSLVDMWSSLDGLPWLPWLGLNNSVVHGSLLIGLGIALPVFFLTRPLAVSLSPVRTLDSAAAVDPDFAHELRPAVSARHTAARHMAARHMAARHTAARHSAARAKAAALSAAVAGPDQRPEPQTAAVAEWDSLAARGQRNHSVSVSVVNEDTCHELEKLLATCNADQANNVSAPQVAQRAAQMAQHVDELLAICDSAAQPPAVQRVDQAAPPDVASAERNRGSFTDASDDTTAIPPVDQTPESLAASTHSSGGTRFIHQPQQPTVVQPYVQPAEQARESTDARDAVHAQERELPEHSGLAEAATRGAIGDAQQAETLRYLLEHLRAIKDKV